MKQRIAGPYKVIPGAGVYAIMRVSDQGGLQPLDPPVSYSARQNAYRRVKQLNEQWQGRDQSAPVQGSGAIE